MLKPGGRFAVSDVVAEGEVPAELRRNMEAWVGCLAGALETEMYTRLLQEAGFEDVGIEITRRYTVAEAGLDPASLPAGWEAGDGKLASAFVRARKPEAAQADEPKTLRSIPVAARDAGCCGSRLLQLTFSSSLPALATLPIRSSKNKGRGEAIRFLPLFLLVQYAIVLSNLFDISICFDVTSFGGKHE